MAPNFRMAILPSPLSLLPSPAPSPFPPNRHPPSLLPLFLKPRSTLPLRTGAVSSATVSLSIGEDLPDDYEDWLPRRGPDHRRRAGILLHPTSFRGPYGIGDLGDEAFRFIDWLHLSGCSVWQVLPLVPPDNIGSPYSGQDANCGNTLLISLEELVKDGLLAKEELPEPVNCERVDFSLVAELKYPLLNKAAERLLQSDGELNSQLKKFCRDPDTVAWLEDAAYFAAIDDSLKAISWYDWPQPLKNRHLLALEEIYQSKKDYIDTFIAKQFLFQRQWEKLHAYAQEKGISIMGDMPIYVGYHSADVWANKRHFLLDMKGFPRLVSGVPPDAFSETGQLWGSPIYDWKAMDKDGYSWWKKRIRRAQDLFDEFRIDHFRGFAGFWAVPAEAKVAMVGRWKAGPGKSIFDAFSQAVGKISIVAEDLDLGNPGSFVHLVKAVTLTLLLRNTKEAVESGDCFWRGVITEDVVQLRKSINAPGMAVLQFGFGSDADNPHLPHNHQVDQVVYTGTHDNDTIRGWWNALKQEERTHVLRYLCISDGDNIPWALIQAALSSVAKTAVIPMQDILGLDNSARMNTPATLLGNWSWRLPSSASFDCLEKEAIRLNDLLSMHGRL